MLIMQSDFLSHLTGVSRDIFLLSAISRRRQVHPGLCGVGTPLGLLRLHDALGPGGKLDRVPLVSVQLSDDKLEEFEVENRVNNNSNILLKKILKIAPEILFCHINFHSNTTFHISIRGIHTILLRMKHIFEKIQKYDIKNHYPDIL